MDQTGAFAVVGFAAAFGSATATLLYFGRREDRDRAEIERLKTEIKVQREEIDDLKVQVKTLSAIVRGGGTSDPNHYGAGLQAS